MKTSSFQVGESVFFSNWKDMARTKSTNSRYNSFFSKLKLGNSRTPWPASNIPGFPSFQTCAAGIEGSLCRCSLSEDPEDPDVGHFMPFSSPCQDNNIKHQGNHVGPSAIRCHKSHELLNLQPLWLLATYEDHIAWRDSDSTLIALRSSCMMAWAYWQSIRHDGHDDS